MKPERDPNLFLPDLIFLEWTQLEITTLENVGHNALSRVQQQIPNLIFAGQYQCFREIRVYSEQGSPVTLFQTIWLLKVF